MSENRDQEKKVSTERIWDATRKTLSNATFRATQYKRIVQKKIDLASLHKKIAAVHADLGKLIDDYREVGKSDILNTEEVAALFRKLDSLKHAAATLEEEIEGIRTEEHSKEKETFSPEESGEREPEGPFVTSSSEAEKPSENLDETPKI